MLTGREGEIANRIGNILMDVMPEKSVRITARSEALDDYASTALEFERPDGEISHFSFDDNPDDAVNDINEALMDLRDLMTGAGQDPWYGVTVTVYQDGRFEVDFSYERLPD